MVNYLQYYLYQNLYQTQLSRHMTAPARKAMRSIIMTHLVSLVVLMSQAQAEIPMGNGRFQSLKITYAIKSNHQEGTEIFIQQDKKTFKELKSTTTWHNLVNKEHTIEIDNGVHFYRINMLDKTAVALPSINKMKEEMVKKNPHLFNDILPSPLLITPKTPPLPDSYSVMDKDCRVYAIKNRLLFIWNDLLLKEVYEEIESVTKTATELQTDIQIPEHYFHIPANVTILSSTDPFDQETPRTETLKTSVKFQN